jgi:hypothetical protein
MGNRGTVQKILWILLAVLLVLMLVGCSSGGGNQFQSPIKPAPLTEHKTFTVGPGIVKTITQLGNAGDRVAGYFTIEGGSGNDIDFSVQDLHKNVIRKESRVSNRGSFDFICTSTTGYLLIFDNGFSIFSNKIIKLTIEYYRN